MDEWPQIRCPRFDGEPPDHYLRRHNKVVEIITNFRRGEYTGQIADDMESLLVELRTPAPEHRV